MLFVRKTYYFDEKGRILDKSIFRTNIRFTCIRKFTEKGETINNYLVFIYIIFLTASNHFRQDCIFEINSLLHRLAFLHTQFL